MDTQLYLALDEVNIGASLALTSADTILQTNSVVDYNRIARSSGSISFASNIEAIYYSPNFLSGALAALPTLTATSLLIGICTSSAPLNKYLGYTSDSYAYNPFNGQVLHSNAVIATITPAAIGDIIGMVCDPINATLTFLLNGLPNGSSFSITASQAWLYAATISGNPGDLAWYINAGQTPFRYPMNKLTGWWKARDTIASVSLATEPWMAGANDDNPYEKFSGDINPIDQQLKINDSVRFWMWGNSAPGELGSGGLVQMQVDDPKGIFNDLTTDAARFDDFPIWRVGSDGTMATAEQIFDGIFDHCEVDTRQTKQIYARDQMSRLSVAVKRALFPPNVDPSTGVSGKPRPISLGICRNYIPEIYDSTNFLYALSDGAISALGRVRVAGKQVVLGGDFNMTTDLAGIDFTNAPVGSITAESTDYGGTFNPASPDYLAGAGDFSSIGTAGGDKVATSATSTAASVGSHTFNVGSGLHFATGSSVTAISRGTPTAFMTGTVTSYSAPNLVINVTSIGATGTHTDWDIKGGVNQPTGWACRGGYPNDYPTTLAQVVGAAPNKTVQFDQEADAVQWFYPLSPVLIRRNHSYAYNIVTTAIPYFGKSVDSTGATIDEPPGMLVFGYLQNHSILWSHFNEISLDHVGTYSGVFINNTGVDQYLSIGFLPNGIIQGGGGRFSSLNIKSLVMNELPALADNIELTGPGLTQMSKNILVTHGPIDISELTTSDTDAIDAATGYTYGIHISSSDTPLTKDLDQQLMDSVCSSRYNDEVGKFRTRRLYDPATGSVTGYLTQTDVMGEIICYPDLAENLTTRLSGCRNYKQMTASEYGDTTTSDVPLNVRAQLAADYQWTATAGIQLASRYFNAYNKPALKTLLDLLAHGQAEITYTNGLYKVARNFFVGKFFEPRSRSFKLMQTWNLKYPIPELASGANLIIVGRQREPYNELCTLILWG